MQLENAVGPLFARFLDYLTVLVIYQCTAKMESLANSSQRMVYLTTYSCVDITKFSSKESFLLAILEAWQYFGILLWVVCIEVHSNNSGCTSSGNINMNLYHFHMAVKLAKRGWLQVRNYLDEKYGIQVNFNNNHSPYYTA